MNLEQLSRGGQLQWTDADGMELPMFVFLVSDLEAAKQLIDGMYVDLDVRFDTSGRLAYHLSVPDRRMASWAIALDPSQISRIEQGAKRMNLCMTAVTQSGAGTVMLTEFVEDLTHDFSGAYARGLKAFAEGDMVGARAALAPPTKANPDTMPAAHHLLGRCFRAQGDLPSAIEHYRRAAKAATHTRGHFLPHASGTLSDLGVAYKKSGEVAKAAHCLAHSLRLRPNHPAALATYFTMFGKWDEGLRYGLTRLAALGSEPGLLGSLAQVAGGALGRDPAVLLREAEGAARHVDVTRSPMGPTAPIPVKEFFDTLDALSGEPHRPVLTPFGTSPLGLPDRAREPSAKPWWKFW